MKEIDINKLGKLISRLRNSKNFSRDEMGAFLGVSGKTVKRWETGETLPTMVDIVHICDKFNISIEEIFEGELSTDKELNRRMSKVDKDYEAISNSIKKLNDQLNLITKEKKRDEDSIPWLYLPAVHVLATAIVFLCYTMGKTGTFEAFLSSIAYVLAISYSAVKNRNNVIIQRFIMFYSIFLEINLLINFAVFSKATPGFINNPELLLVNGAIYGFRCLDMNNMVLLLIISMLVYSLWIVYCGYHLSEEGTTKAGNIIAASVVLFLVLLLVSFCGKTPGEPMGRIIADQSLLSESKEAENNLAFKTVYNKKEIYINEEGDHRISQGYDLYCYNGKLNNQKVYFFFDDNACVSFAILYYDHAGKKTSVYYRGSNKEIDSLPNSAVISGEVLKCITDSLQNNKKFYLYHFGSASNIYVVFESGEFYLIDGVELGMKIEFPDNFSPEYSQITLF